MDRNLLINSNIIMKKMKILVAALLLQFLCVSIYAQGKPPIPAPPGKKWVKIKNMSDEFNTSNKFNTRNIWDVNDPQWPGRSPGIFEKSNVEQWGGLLRLQARKLKPFEVRPNPGSTSKWKKWTHGGALVRSKQRAKYGYFEVKMKANETFMSSTFWLIHRASNGNPLHCTNRTIEADITENVGQVMPGADLWVPATVNNMYSTMHSRFRYIGQGNKRRSTWSPACKRQQPAQLESFSQKNWKIGGKASAIFSGRNL